MKMERQRRREGEGEGGGEGGLGEKIRTRYSTKAEDACTHALLLPRNAGQRVRCCVANRCHEMGLMRGFFRVVEYFSVLIGLEMIFLYDGDDDCNKMAGVDIGCVKINDKASSPLICLIILERNRFFINFAVQLNFGNRWNRKLRSDESWNNNEVKLRMIKRNLVNFSYMEHCCALEYLLS